MRRSYYKRRQVPTVDLRVRIPRQLRNDVKVVAQALSVHEGELISWAVTYFLQTLVPKWNEQSYGSAGVTSIPDLPSLTDRGGRRLNVIDVIEESLENLA